MIILHDLQLFANAGTKVNTTTGYVNADTGSGANTGDLTDEIKSFYDTELLENVRSQAIYAQFGKKTALPAHHGKTVEWRKWNTFAKAGSITEGVIPSGQKFGMSTVTGTVVPYGTYASISDKLELTAYDDIILGATEEMAASAAETMEWLIRQALLSVTNVLYCDNVVTTSDGTKTVTVPTKCTEMGASDTNGWALLTPDMINRAVTKMKKMKAPAINGRYYCVIHPSVSYDLRKSTEWLDVHKYASPDEIFRGEIGELHGCRFIENPNAPVLDTGYTNKDGTVSYASFLFGKDSFATIDPEGGALEMIIHDKDEIGGPLNQFSTIGYKMTTNGATVLYPERVMRIMSTSSYSATDTAN